MAEMTQPRQVRDPARAGARRDGRRVRRLRPDDQAHRRAEDDPRRSARRRERRDHRRALSPRGAGGRAAQPPEHRRASTISARNSGVWYIAMEYVKGRELKDYFQANERFATADIVRIMTQILAALGYSHRAGVDPPRHQAGERLPAGRRHGQGRRLRHRAHRIVEHDAGGHRARHAELHVARADPGTADRRALGSLLRRRHPLPVPDRRAAVQRLGDDHDAQGAGGGSAAAVALQRAGAGRDGRRGRARRSRSVPTIAFRAPRNSPKRCARRAAACRGTGRSDVDRGRRSDRRQRACAEAGHCSPRPRRRCRRARRRRQADAPAPPPAKKSQTAAIAIVAGVAVIAIAAGLWTMMQSPRGRRCQGCASAGAASRAHRRPARPRRHRQRRRQRPHRAPHPRPTPARWSFPRRASSIRTIRATPPTRRCWPADLRADSKSQLVEKALGLMLDSKSLATNYDVLNDEADVEERRVRDDGRGGERAESRQGRPHVDDDPGGRQREGAAEVAQPDVARRARRVHSRGRRPESVRAHRHERTPISRTRRRSRRRSPRTC